MKKRPLACEGHLRLPFDVAPRRAPCPAPTAAAPDGGEARTGGARVRLLGGAPFDVGGRTRTAEVLSDALQAHGLRRHDRVVLTTAQEPEFGDLVAALEQGEAALWKAYPENGLLILCCGDTRRVLTAEAVAAGAILGVIIGVKRPLTGARVASKTRQ